MNKTTRLLGFFIIFAVILTACNLPSGDPEDVNATAAAQTLEALLSATPSISTTTPTVPATITLIPSPAFTSTPVPTATPNCPLAQFVTDVTIPDGTIMTPGQTFTKKWRLRNTSACAWNGYSLVFDSGDSMNGPASKPIGVINPGQEVDLEVNLTAPNSPGNYRGYWRIVTNTNVLVPIVNGYQGRSFYVDIKVQAPPTVTNTSAPSSTTITLDNIAGESGQVRSDGTVLGPPNTGDIESNAAAQAFFSFNMSSIPAGATITKVVVNFSSYDTLGNPWSLADGCLRAYVQNYGTLDAGDFFPGDPTSAVIRWCGAAELSSVFEDSGMKAVVQSAVGSSRLQLRVQFRAPTTSSNGIADMIRFGTVKLIITYQ
ncbi:MAG: hypothetical protein DPW18_04960 [Chloroflexi bacterium]|nr:hypothetical protein [Chloroflexota bacterium]MDL1943196.1 hypothetical protein [Chloroflexi bacterium CFX2]